MSKFSLDSLLKLSLKFHKFLFKKVIIQGESIYYFEKRVCPARGTIVFVHGIGSNAGHFSRIMIELYKKGYSILALDLPGHGDSSDPVLELTGDHLYSLFKGWVNEVAPTKFALVGNSLGGALCMKYSADYPDRISRQILASPAGGFGSELEWKEFKKGLDFKEIKDSTQFTKRVFYKDPFYLPIISRILFKAMTRTGVRQLLESTRVSDLKLQEEGLKITVPTLVIWGKAERLFPQDHLNLFKKSLPVSVCFEEPEKIGHCPQFDNPKWFSQRIFDFLQ